MRLNEYLFKELNNTHQLICDLCNKIKDLLERWMTRDDFSEPTKRSIAMRVNYICSNPTCRRYTLKPKVNDPYKWDTLGEAAHIKSASRDRNGPRADPNLTPEERNHPKNGIWLCLRCHTIIDREPDWATIELLQSWKKDAELRAVSNSADDDFKQSTIDSLTFAIRSLNSFLDQILVYNLRDHDLWSKVVKNETSCEDYTTNMMENFEKTKREYEKSIFPEIQVALLRCQNILGESNEIVINAFEELEHSSCNQLTMKYMLPILYELKETVQWR